jgi:hypothetical protein
MAELIAIHRWSDSQLALAHAIGHREEVPDWGRVRLLKDAVKAGNTRSLNEVLAIEPLAFRQVDSYAWAWAACEFLSKHPRSADAFKQLPDHVAQNHDTFNRWFRDRLLDVWDDLEFEWQLFLREVDYGFDVAGMAVRASGTPQPLTAKRGSFDVQSACGWQTTGVLVRAGEHIRLVAQGEFQIADDGTPWISQANGVTLEYHQGRPVGRLLMSVFPSTGTIEAARHLAVIDVGEETVVEIPMDGVLALRINDSPAKLRDNRGQLNVTWQRQP